MHNPRLQASPAEGPLWQTIVALSDRVRAGEQGPFFISAPAVAGFSATSVIRIELGGHWSGREGLPAPALDLLDLYLPVAMSPLGQNLVVGHLGQSLDGRIATDSGDSFYVTGERNLDHLHRLRALCDAVVVGAGTVCHDDPWLTVRRVAGSHPVRVVIDTNRRLGGDYRLFHDTSAPTLLFCADDRIDAGPLPDGIEVIGLRRRDDGLDLRQLLDLLARRGLHRVFVEGGGVTVSRFLEQGCLHRLQLAVAPLIIGSGRHGINLSKVQALADCLRPTTRQFRQGEDMLFDCVLHSGHG